MSRERGTSDIRTLCGLTNALQKEVILYSRQKYLESLKMIIIVEYQLNVI